jgi:Na+/melibiose symporter-like transporter
LISKVSSAKSLTFTGIQARHYFINVSWKGLNFWEKQEYWSDVQGIALLFTILLVFFLLLLLIHPTLFFQLQTNNKNRIVVYSKHLNFVLGI